MTGISSLVSGAKLAPGTAQESPRRKPWDKHSNNGSPEGAMQWCWKEVPYEELLSGVETEPPCTALSGLSAIWTLNPGLAPWAVLLDPFGSLVLRQKLVSFCRKTPRRC